MKRYVIERDIPGVGRMNREELKGAAGVSNAALAKLSGAAQWVHSYVVDDKTFCIYLAESPEAVQEHARISGFPANKVTEIHSRIDPMTAADDELRAALGEVQVDPTGLTRDDWLDLLMTHRLQPGFADDAMIAIHDWPASQCALARLRRGDDGIAVAERFELYLGALEVANGYHELADAVEQGQRFEREAVVRTRRGDVVPPVDGRLLDALRSGLPDCAGVALGVDRLMMAMLGTGRIADVVAFDFFRA